MLSSTRMEPDFFGSKSTFNWWPSGRVLACQVSIWGSRPVDPIVLLVAPHSFMIVQYEVILFHCEVGLLAGDGLYRVHY